MKTLKIRLFVFNDRQTLTSELRSVIELTHTHSSRNSRSAFLAYSSFAE